MKSPWFTTLFLLVLATALNAQEPVVTTETPVDNAILHQWLHSGNPRLIAWSADFARRTHDAEIVAEMPEILEHWTLPSASGGDEYPLDSITAGRGSQTAQRRAVLAILDTLIQENAKVPVAAIDAFAPSFPVQAAILIARLPLSASRSTLENWTYRSAGNWSESTLAIVATMMIAKDPLPSSVFRNNTRIGFVASVVDTAEEDLRITVRKDSSPPPGYYGIGGACGDSLGHELAPGWPQVYAYGLAEANRQGISGPVLVDLDGDQIYSWRVKENGGGGMCASGGVQPLNSQTGHRLLAYWLGISEGAMSWKPVENFTIVWTNKIAYQRQLGAIVESQRQKLDATVEALRHQGFLRGDEAAMPRLVVTVQCEMATCLPQ
jgi:hypothetical protein